MSLVIKRLDFEYIQTQELGIGKLYINGELVKALVGIEFKAHTLTDKPLADQTAYLEYTYIDDRTLEEVTKRIPLNQQISL